MRDKKRMIVMCSLMLGIILLSIGTIAYFRRTVNGNITGQAGNLVLIVNEANAAQNETFTVSLNRSEDEPFVMPDDKGMFNINIDSTGSSSDVEVIMTLSRMNLPDNLKFYLDENYTEEFSREVYKIQKSDDMTKTVPVYWYWDGSVDDFNDSLYINKLLEASVNVSATIYTEKTFLEYLKNKSTLDTNVNFGEVSSETNGKGLMMMSSTQNDANPILYYRGSVIDNNMIFGGFCWLIVRTTETGGIKLLYNGEPNEDGSCNIHSLAGANSGIMPDPNGNDKSYIEHAFFNEDASSPVYVGYMYNDDNKFFSLDPHTMDIAGYKAHLADNTIDIETGHHTQNLKDSNAKTIIDSWYESNLLGTKSEKMIEDTVWCNDRSVISETYSIENYWLVGPSGRRKGFIYSSGTRLGAETLFDVNLSPIVTPSLHCNRDIDKFTVDDKNGNGDLNYPIGMLTADEASLGGLIFEQITPDNYLFDFTEGYYSMTPVDFRSACAEIMLLSADMGYMPTIFVGEESVWNIRPSISIQLGSIMPEGNGSFQTPYIVE